MLVSSSDALSEIAGRLGDCAVLKVTLMRKRYTGLLCSRITPKIVQKRWSENYGLRCTFSHVV